MSNTVLTGLQWGDEGKGKIIDVLTEQSDVVARFQGGCNAGHTVEVEGNKFILHLLPSGVARPETHCIIGNGVVVDPIALASEIRDLEENGYDIRSRLSVSMRSHLVFSYHKQMDSLEEKRLGKGKIGTTKRGIGPAYADKARRTGIRAEALQDERMLEEQFREQARAYNDLFNYQEGEQIDIEQSWQELKAVVPYIAPLLADTTMLLHERIDKGEHVLFEGAQGTWLDVDYGTYPFVTSSNTIAGSACVGAGVPPAKIQHVLGVAKAYTTRVGSGPFPTELTDKEGEKLQKGGAEYGATTGRPRRCGWFDAAATRYAVMLNGADSVAITKLDVLDDFDRVQICTGYMLNGGKVDALPPDMRSIESCEPVYEELPGWKTSTKDVRHWDELPQAAKDYLHHVSELIGAPVSLVSVGPDRSQTFSAQQSQ